MKRDFSLKPRKEASIPAEKLMEVLCGIYPENMAKEIFNNLQSKMKEDDDDK